MQEAYLATSPWLTLGVGILYYVGFVNSGDRSNILINREKCPVVQRMLLP
jgi:hypothetical protein